jgi:hypothetical protein
MENTAASISKDVEFPSFFAEFNSDLLWDHVGLNVGIEYIPGSTELGAKSRTDANTISTDDGTYTAKAEAENFMSFYVEPTLMINENFGLYGKAAISRITIKSLESIDNGGTSSTYGDEGVMGGTIGVGVRGQLGIFAASNLATKMPSCPLTPTPIVPPITPSSPYVELVPPLSIDSNDLIVILEMAALPYKPKFSLIISVGST